MTQQRCSIRLIDVESLPGERERARARGRVQTNFDLPEQPWHVASEQIICTGLATEDSVLEIVSAALRGADLVVALPDEPWSVPLVRDLDRIGKLEFGEVATPDPASVLNDDQRQLLGLLAAGLSIPEAAGELFLSVRTAERRLGAARRLLGIRTTAEAVLLVGVAT